MPECPKCTRIGAFVPADLTTLNPAGRKAKVISSLGDEPEQDVPRISTGFANLDEMFGGGGIPRGNVIQLGGQPGIGKSTLLAQIAANISNRERVLIITSEESKRRLAHRVRRVAGEDAAKRIDAIATLDDNLGVDEVKKLMKKHPARFVIIDSLQGLRKIAEDVGRNKKIIVKHTQYIVRDIALEMINEAKSPKKTIVLTCHVTKDGALAGLKEIEHMVDVVCWFTGNPTEPPRQMKCSKNRDGDTSVVSLFSMTGAGLVPATIGAAAAKKQKEKKSEHSEQIEKVEDQPLSEPPF